MITFAAMYRSLRWRGPMVVAYGTYERWPSACEWMVPNSDKEEQTPADLLFNLPPAAERSAQ